MLDSEAVSDCGRAQLKTNIVKAFFEPRSVAVVGASRTPGRAGHQQLMNLKGGFEGDVYAVNPGTDTIEGLPCYPSVVDIPDSIELAIVLTPGRYVAEVVESCVEAEIPAVLIPASGFCGSKRGRRRLDSSVCSIRFAEHVPVCGDRTVLGC